MVECRHAPAPYPELNSIPVALSRRERDPRSSASGPWRKRLFSFGRGIGKTLDRGAPGCAGARRRGTGAAGAEQYCAGGAAGGRQSGSEAAPEEAVCVGGGAGGASGSKAAREVVRVRGRRLGASGVTITGAAPSGCSQSSTLWTVRPHLLSSFDREVRGHRVRSPGQTGADLPSAFG